MTDCEVLHKSTCIAVCETVEVNEISQDYEINRTMAINSNAETPAHLSELKQNSSEFFE